MTDEIASFKVTAADIQKQEFHPSGDVHMQRGGHFVCLEFLQVSWKANCELQLEHIQVMY